MFNKIASTFSTKVITSLINLLIVIIISRNMGAMGKGETSLIITSIALVMMLCNILSGATLVYLVPRRSFFQLFILAYAWTLLTCCLAFTVITLLLRNSELITVVQLYLKDIFLLSLLNSFLLANLMLLLGKERILSNNIISLLQSLINVGLLFALVYGLNERNTGSYIQTLYVSFGACTLMSLLLLGKYFNSFSLEGFGELLKESLKLGAQNQVGHIMQFVSLRLSYYILEATSGNDAVGVYSNSVSVVESIWLITNSIAVVQYARIANSNDKLYSQQLTLRLARFSTMVCITVLALMLLLPSSFYVWIFGSGFGEMNKVILLLAPGVLLYNTGLIIGHYFSGIGKYYVNSIGNLCGLIITAIASFLLFDEYNIYYAATIATASYIVMSLYVLTCFMKEANAGLKELAPKMEELKFVGKEAGKILRKKA